MSAPASPRGGAPVGLLTDLDPVGAGAVLAFRLWHDGPAAQARLCADFARCLGPGDGQCALGACAELCRLCHDYARRPLMRHGTDCPCLGADEACFARVVADASEGAREDAMLVAALMVRPDMAPAAVHLAEALGLALKRLALGTVAEARRGPLH